MLKPVAIMLMIAVSAPAGAQITFETPATATPSAPAANGKDSNKLICEKQEEIGSRLASKKVCKTAAQWQEERRQQRETLEKIQQQGTGTPSSG